MTDLILIFHDTLYVLSKSWLWYSYTKVNTNKIFKFLIQKEEFCIYYKNILVEKESGSWDTDFKWASMFNQDAFNN